MQIEKLLEEQRAAFVKYYLDIHWNSLKKSKELESEANIMFQLHKSSLKQFIDGLIEREEGEFQDEHPVDCIDGVTPVETYGYEATYNQAKKETISHLKKLKEELN